MVAVAHDGDLAAYADEVTERSLAMWATPGVLTAVLATSFGELPGSVVVNFPTIDALCHAWDLSASLGRPLEFPPESFPAITAVVEATCTDEVWALGLINDVAPIAPDASDTDRLMAQAGRAWPTIPPDRATSSTGAPSPDRRAHIRDRLHPGAPTAR